MFEVSLLVAAVTFGLTGLVILTLYLGMSIRGVATRLREHFAISRVNSRNRNSDSLRAA